MPGVPIKLKKGIHIDSGCTGILQIQNDGIFIPMEGSSEELQKDLDAFLNRHWVPSGSAGKIRAIWVEGELRPTS